VQLADVVCLKIKESIGPGCCVAEGWSCGGTHYFGIIHIWPMLDEHKNITTKKVLLSCQPLLDEILLMPKRTLNL
jgi:hypothetical protein